MALVRIIILGGMMIKSQCISTRISKVNQELEKLAGLIKNDRNLQNEARQALLQCNYDESSDDSFGDLELEQFLSKSKGFSRFKVETISNSEEEIESLNADSTTKSAIRTNPMISDSNEQPTSNHCQEPPPDTTVKKFHPLENPFRKKRPSKEKSKVNSKVKNTPKSEKNFQSVKTDSSKKKKKPEKELKKSALMTSQFKTNLKKSKPNQNKTLASHTRFSDPQKMHISIKKEAILKITDLNIQRQHCQKESEYLKAAVKVTQESLNVFADAIGVNTEEANLKVFMAKSLVKFFSQFFCDWSTSDELTNAELEFILVKPNYLNQYMIRLPEILKKDNTLCEDRCTSLFEQKYFLDRKLPLIKSLAIDQLCLYLDTLHDYISFLLNNNIIRETKRRQLPVQFHSERERKRLLIRTVQKKEHQKEYDSERKREKTTGLKRVNTHKVLSPKSKQKGRK